MKSKSILAGMVSFLLALALGTVPLSAQFTSGIEGTVTDPSGAVVPNASVTIRNVDTDVEKTGQTTSAGNYRFTSLPASVYTISVSANGFKKTVHEKVTVNVAETKTVNMAL